MGDNNVNNQSIAVQIPSDDESFFERPFFAYGIFKKGQLAHSKIADCVETVIPDEIHREMRIRDGVPVITGEDSEYKTKGDKIYFNEKSEEAYKRISYTQPRNIYKWDIIDIGDETFNILITEKLPGTYLNVDEERNYLDAFDGSEDPFFSIVPDFILNELDELDTENDDYAIFKIQMYYMLLWSAIERYCVLKYDVSKNQGDILDAFAEDEMFKEAFEITHPKGRDAIYSAITARPFFYNRKIPKFIVNHYYTIRCNVAHRGKEPGNNIDNLEESLNDLLDIFKIIIEKTFNEE